MLKAQLWTGTVSLGACLLQGLPLARTHCLIRLSLSLFEAFSSRVLCAASAQALELCLGAAPGERCMVFMRLWDPS